MSHGMLMLAGSGEFTPSMREIDRYVLQDIQNPRVAIIPTAAGREDDWWKWVRNGITHFRGLQIAASGIPLRTAEDATDSTILEQLKTANVFYFSGGDPGYLLAVLHNSPVWEYIYEAYMNGAVIAGCSAGAMMLGTWVLSNIYDVWESGSSEFQWTRAYACVPYTIWPHFDEAMRTSPGILKKIMDHAPEEAKTEWVGIDEDTVVIWKPGKDPEILGRGTAHWGHV